MNNKEIQEQRMRGYFIQAAKEILKGEGLVCVSARNVADRAGYSYATLYNYFKDVKDLVFECAREFLEEARGFVESGTGGAAPGIASIKAIIKAYINYFIQYPGIFELFFLEKESKMGNRQRTAELIYGFLDSLSEQDWNACCEKAIVSRAEADALKDRIRFTVTGMLLFYVNRRHAQSYHEFMDSVETEISRIFEQQTDHPTSKHTRRG